MGFSSFFLTFFFALSLSAASLLEENKQIEENSLNVEGLYELKDDEKWRDITNEVLNYPGTSQTSKDSIIKYQRRIILFRYPSNGLSIKGFLSFTPNPEHNPLLILFRWGNQNFALMNPGVNLATYKDYTVITSTLRGGVSEGKDEFGGADVEDMKNLINCIPHIASEIGIVLHPHCTFMLGGSRGGLEMFLTLSRHHEIQAKIDKVVSLSSLLDLHNQIQNRPLDMKPMLEQEFGMPKTNAEDWIKERNPLLTAGQIRPSMPILIVQGTADPRIKLEEGYHMVDALEKTGHYPDYWEIPQGNHILTNVPNLMDQVSVWLEKNLSCHGEDPRQYLKN